MIRRRLFCQALGSAGTACAAIARAQAPTRVYRLGILDYGRPPSLPDPVPPPPDVFHAELARLGLVEGANLRSDARSAHGDPALLDAVAAELVATRPDVLYTDSGFAATRALKKATTTIPIVFGAMGEPVAAGLVASLARPGGNLTGGAVPSELELKRIQILFEVLGASARAALLMFPLPPRRHARFFEALGAARERLQIIEVNRSEDLPGAFEQMVRLRVGGVAVALSPLTGTHSPEIAALAVKHRLPGIGDGPYADLGMLMSYSIDWQEVERNAANYVYKIMKGAQPADMPVEQVAKFDFVLNLKAARALGVRVPSSVMIRATRLIN